MRWRWLRLVVLATLLLAAHPSTALATSSSTASEVGYSVDYVAEDVLAAHSQGAGRLPDRPVESRARGDSRAGEVRLRPAVELFAPRTAVGFAPGEGVSALTTNRLQHGTRHLTDAGVLPPWRGSSSPQIIGDSLSPVLERPTAAFDHVLGGTRVRGFLGDVNGQQVAVFVYKEGPYQGQLASSVIPTPNQLAKWGAP